MDFERIVSMKHPEGTDWPEPYECVTDRAWNTIYLMCACFLCAVLIAAVLWATTCVTVDKAEREVRVEDVR